MSYTSHSGFKGPFDPRAQRSLPLLLPRHDRWFCPLGNEESALFPSPCRWVSAFNGLRTHLLEQYAGGCWSHDLTINFVERDEWVLRRCCRARKRPWGQRNCPLESNSMVTWWADLKQEIYVFSSFPFALKGIVTRHNELEKHKNRCTDHLGDRSLTRLTMFFTTFGPQEHTCSTLT